MSQFQSERPRPRDGDRTQRVCTMDGFVPAGTVINMDSCSDPPALNRPQTAHAKEGN